MKRPSLACGLSLLALAGLSSGLSAQSAQVDSQLESWRADNGASWQVRGAYESTYARMLFGGSTEAVFAPVTETDFVDLARSYVDQTGSMFAVDNSVLEMDEVLLLPLGSVGSTDKMTVRFQQHVNGVPVEYGSVNVLMNMAGGLLSIDARSIPNVAAQDTVPTIQANEALQIAVAEFQSETGTAPTGTGMIELNIIRREGGGVTSSDLAWRIQVTNHVDGFEPESFVYQVAAQGSARVLRRENGIHNFDVGGTVTTGATLTNKPDTAANPPVAVPAAYMTITAPGQGSITSDANGDFNFAGATGPLDVTFSYSGLYNDVNNSAGSEYSRTETLTGTGNAVALNPTANGLVTAQSNVFYFINQMRDWTRTQNAGDSAMDAVNTSNANISSSCNAFFDGSSTNYYQPGGGCVNTAYATVIYHEQGHWQNVRYNSGNGSDGFGEGNADVYATYQTNWHLLGEDFFGPGTTVRDAMNLRQYCGDGNGGCYGQVHTDGEVLMGALWKVRTAVQASLGDGPGGDVCDSLLGAWMNAYDQGTIDSIIELQWLTLDDDNGDLQDGTPNFNDIDGGFRIQGFPGIIIGGSQAKASTRNGTGINPDVYTTAALPILGSSWASTVDANGIGTVGTFTRAFYFAEPLNTGLTIGLGEVLVNPASALQAATDARIQNNGLAAHSAAIPSDIALDGLAISVQVYIPTGGTLTNAIDLCLGTF
ncbi:MAG: hypothetical protein ACI8QS_000373 [Planctomycetota bacterium]|jgi:hypothetical protein